jgi:hypothetical protein
MRNGQHPNEDTLNMYLDGELDADEHRRVEAHLSACETCRAELQTYQDLFIALEEIELSPTPAPDLAPDVLTRIQPSGRTLGLRWLVPALQGTAALALLAWGWTRLVGYWTAIASALPTKTLGGTWDRTAEWLITQWVTLNTLPGTAWASAKSWIARPRLFGSPGFSLPQVVVAGAILGMLWLACNVILLHRTIVNGKNARSIRRS